MNGRSARGAAALALAASLAVHAAAAQDRTPTAEWPPYDPIADAPGAAPPFVLQADDQTRARAVRCLTEAIYYEAGAEPREGQEAVAQVVLNRLRHPAFPKSVCGVVFEGSDRGTGCQFTFTCDGSLARRPVSWRWDAAQAVANAALDGYVAAEVGASTHYHAAWMTPYWSASLVQTRRIGGHIFYRMPGAAGSPDALTGRYSGDEPASPAAAILSEASAAAVHGPIPAAPARGVSQFSVWGLQVATITAHRGEIVVRGGS